jgi:hypothetical protein
MRKSAGRSGLRKDIFRLAGAAIITRQSPPSMDLKMPPLGPLHAPFPRALVRLPQRSIERVRINLDLACVVFSF